MAWTYSGDPSTSERDQVRFLVGDTDTNDQLLTDEEISYLLTTKKNVVKAAIEACNRLIAKFSRDVDYSIGPEKVSAGDRVKQFKSLKEELVRDSIESNAAPFWGGSELLEEQEPLFDLGMHDNRG